MKILFWHPTGSLIEYSDGMLYISNLNPETNTWWRMSRWEMFVTGWSFIWVSFRFWKNG